MRKLIVAASIVLLAACASPQKEEQISINPQPTLSNQKMVDNVTFHFIEQRFTYSPICCSREKWP